MPGLLSQHLIGKHPGIISVYVYPALMALNGLLIKHCLIKDCEKMVLRLLFIHKVLQMEREVVSLPRIPVLALDKMPEKTRNMITGGKSGMSGLNINRVMAHAENSVRHFMRMGNSLLTQAKLDARLRELAILRVAALCSSRYEWYQHEILAREVGVPGDQIEAVKNNPESPVFSELERAVLRYAGEVTQNVKSSDEAFDHLTRFLSHQELVELTLTIGFYNMVARFLENTEVQIEDSQA